MYVIITFDRQKILKMIHICPQFFYDLKII